VSMDSKCLWIRWWPIKPTEFTHLRGPISRMGKLWNEKRM